MAVRLRHITFDCSDPYLLATFWGEVTGWKEDPGNGNAPEDPEGYIVAPDGELSLLFVKVPEGKQTKNRLHLDFWPIDRTRDEEITRLLDIGATIVDDLRNPDGTGWTVLADPEGNEFCVIRSASEREATPSPSA